MEGILQDVRYGLRTLRRSPGFTAIAALTLALGIGANTAIFSTVNAALLSPLPFPQSDRLVVLRALENGKMMLGPSPADALDYARANHSFEQFAVYDYWRKNVSGIAGDQDAQEMLVGLVPTAYFDALRIRPVIGRLFHDEENVYGKHYVAVINTTIWRKRYDSDPKVLGQTIRINDEPYTIVGVIPDVIPTWITSQQAFTTQIWTPMTPYPNWSAEASRGERGMFTIARLKAGVTLAQAEADLNVIAAQLAQHYPIDQGVGVKLVPLADVRVGPIGPVLLLLSAAVGVILLIACSNLTNLLLVRHSKRRRELAVRTALGGARAVLMRQLIVESLLLSVLGGALGMLLAFFGERVVVLLRPQQFAQLDAMHLDTRVLLFSLGISLFAALLAGLMPAVTATRVNLVDALKEGGRGTTSGANRQRVRRWLVVAETALSLMLMIAAGLLIQTIVRLQRQQIGFNPSHLLRAHLYLPPARYRDSASLTHFADALRQRVAALPGVREATITSIFPPRNRWEQYFSVIGQQPARPHDLPQINFGVADEHFLATFGIPLLRGRNFAATDTDMSVPVALINETAARRFFSDLDPIGRRVHLGDPDTAPIPGSAELSADLTVIGVVGNTRNHGLAEAAAPQLIALYRQLPAVNFGFKELIVRTAGEPLSLAPAIRERLHQLDADVPLAEVTTIAEVVSQQTADTRFTTVLLGSFAGLGIALAIIGVYGVISYAATQRTHEIGVRVALGATTSQVLWLVVRPGFVMGLLGAGLGVLGAAAARRLLSRLLFGISPLDPTTFLIAAVLLLCAVVAACLIPARRASRVDPMVALRYE